MIPGSPTSLLPKVKSALTPDSHISLVQCLQKKPEASGEILTRHGKEIPGQGTPDSSGLENGVSQGLGLDRTPRGRRKRDPLKEGPQLGQARWQLVGEERKAQTAKGREEIPGSLLCSLQAAEAEGIPMHSTQGTLTLIPSFGCRHPWQGRAKDLHFEEVSDVCQALPTWVTTS